MSLFGSSGIRGIVDEELTLNMCGEIAQALGTMLPLGAEVCLATDTRVSGETLKRAIISGLLSCGINVTDVGILPTPALAFVTGELGFDSGVMVTASHNPPEFNGIKLFNKNSLGYSWDQEQEIERIYLEKGFRTSRKGLCHERQGIEESYFDFIKDRFDTEKLNRSLTIVVDPGNGAASGLISRLFSEMGLGVIPLNDIRDGLFPGRNPEPREDTLLGTVDFLRKVRADMAICFDGDADRVVFCDREGFLGFNEPITFISRKAVEETGKKRVVSTVETGRLLDLAVKDLGAEVVRGKVGDVNVASLTREIDAAIGVEQVGVYIFPYAGYYPDSILAALTLLSQITEVSEIRDFFKEIPQLFFEKRKIFCPSKFKETVMGTVKEKAHYLESKAINTLDGVRLEFDDSWMLVRASGTEPAIRVIAESISNRRTVELLRKGMQMVEESIACNSGD